MRKSRLPFFIIVSFLVGGIAAALVPNLFPDTPGFPRVPKEEGTIGALIANILDITELSDYIGDGTVPNSRLFDGASATGYLKVQFWQCDASNKWIWLNTDGDPICGSTTPAPSDYGRIISQDCEANAYNPDGSQSSTNTGDTLTGGTIIATAPGCTMTIGFSDLSLIRLDGDTVVSFDLGYLPSGNTIASALLENGSLWGRILTETGSYNVGTREIIAWVRGTSVALISTGRTLAWLTYTSTGWQVATTPTVYPTTITVVDSVLDTGAAKVSCRASDTGFFALPDLPREGSYIVPPGGCTLPAVWPIATAYAPVIRWSDTLYAESPWILRNTAWDIQYMYDIISLSGARLSSTLSAVVTDELSSTIPMRGDGGALSASGLLEASLLCSTTPWYRWWNERYQCQPANVLAIANFQKPTLSSGDPPTLDIYTTNGIVSQSVGIRSAGGAGSSSVYEPFSGMRLITAGAHLALNIPNIQNSIIGGTLSGKTLEIRVDREIAASSNYLVLSRDGDTNLWIKRNTAWTSYKCDNMTCSMSPYDANGGIYRYRFRTNIWDNSSIFIGWATSAVNQNSQMTVRWIRILE